MLSKLLALCFLITYCAAVDRPEVKTPLGSVRGYIKKSYGGRDFAAFEGIPYAKPPINELRFQDPVPNDPWKGVWDATLEHECIQYAPKLVDTIKGEEDCLYINVYVPLDKLDSSQNLDVIVHIHGGAFMMGSGSRFTKPDLLMDRDVIFVTLNYRLGILGFLATGEGTLAGNQGLKDQVQALKWVQANIASFGGNPDSVTLTGLSAGGGSVNFHLLSPLSKGLFHRAFSESGSALNPWALQERPFERTKKLADLVGCLDKDVKETVECLKSRPASALLSQLPHFYEFETHPLVPFGPVVESSKVSNRFLTKHPLQAYHDKEAFDVPWLVGTSAHEGIVPGGWLWPIIDELDEKWPEMAPFVLDYNYTAVKYQWAPIAERIKEHYLGEGVKISRDNFPQIIKLLSDRIFINGIELAMRKQASVNKSPVYYFVFSHENQALSFFPDIKGAIHGLSAFYYYGDANIPYPEEDRKLIPKMVDMLVAFAKTGVPKFEGVQWDSINGEDISYVNIGGPDNIKSETASELTPREFWKNLMIMENEKIFVLKDEL